MLIELDEQEMTGTWKHWYDMYSPYGWGKFYKDTRAFYVCEIFRGSVRGMPEYPFQRTIIESGPSQQKQHSAL